MYGFEIKRHTRSTSRPHRCGICKRVFEETMIAVCLNDQVIGWECLPCNSREVELTRISKELHKIKHEMDTLKTRRSVLLSDRRKLRAKKKRAKEKKA